MPFIKFSPIERRRLSIFFVCLFFAFGAWLFFALSNRYVYPVQSLVRFVNIPENKAFSSLQSDTIKLKVEGTGWQLLFSKLKINPHSVDIDLESLNKQSFIDLSDQLKHINQKFQSKQKVIGFEPDTLYFDFSSRVIKRIPIRVNTDIQFDKQYAISEKIDLSPSYVRVSGPKEELQELEFWNTDTLKLKNISSDINTRISLKNPLKANISVYPKDVGVKIHVDEFTEKVIEVPVKLLNNNEFYRVKLLPEKVKITFLTSLKKYKEIERKDFDLTVDLDKWKSKGYKQLPVIINKFPQYCQLVKIEPQSIDFIIQK